MTNLIIERSRIPLDGCENKDNINGKQKASIKKASWWEWLTGRSIKVTIGTTGEHFVNKASLNKFILRNANDAPTNPKPLSFHLHFFALGDYSKCLQAALVRISVPGENDPEEKVEFSPNPLEIE